MIQIEAEPRRIHYALGPSGVRLPVVDVTHPAFALQVTDDEQRLLVEQFLAHAPRAASRSLFRDILLRFVVRRAPLVSSVRASRGAPMGAMTTYLLKLGPEPFADAAIDRRAASSLAALSARLRLQDMAGMLADAVSPRLALGTAGALSIVSLAGGTAMEALNALVLLTQQGLLASRRTRIAVLDLDTEGPAFGRRALEALRSAGGPLERVDASLDHVTYDWNDVAPLSRLLANLEGVVVVAAEGGLFEYGSDDAIAATLECLRAAPEELAIVGSVTRADEPVQRLRDAGYTATRPRGQGVFRALVKRSGWDVTRVIERPFSDSVTLERA